MLDVELIHAAVADLEDDVVKSLVRKRHSNIAMAAPAGVKQQVP